MPSNGVLRGEKPLYLQVFSIFPHICPHLWKTVLPFSFKTTA
jgi:hypothetical protein